MESKTEKEKKMKTYVPWLLIVVVVVDEEAFALWISRCISSSRFRLKTVPQTLQILLSSRCVFRLCVLISLTVWKSFAHQKQWIIFWCQDFLHSSFLSLKCFPAMNRAQRYDKAQRYVSEKTEHRDTNRRRRSTESVSKKTGERGELEITNESPIFRN